MSLPSDVHPQVTFTVRRAIWRWIQIFPSEYLDSLLNPKTLSGTSQRLFDILMGKVEESNRSYMWPALTALLIISSEKMKETATNFISGGVETRNFFQSSKKVLSDSFDSWRILIWVF